MFDRLHRHCELCVRLMITFIVSRSSYLPANVVGWPSPLQKCVKDQGFFVLGMYISQLDDQAIPKS